MKDVLKILEKDARYTPEQIAVMTGKPVAEVKSIIGEAERDGTILKYKTIVNWPRVGERGVWALVEVKLVPQRDVGFDAMAERIYRFPQARTVYLVSGTYDLAVIARGKTMNEIAEFVTQKLAPIEGVHGTMTHFLLKKYKEDGEIMEGGDGNKRQPMVL